MISVEHSDFFDNQFSISIIPLTFGPFLYLYTKHLLHKGSFSIRKDLVHFTPFALFTIGYLVFFQDKLHIDNYKNFLDRNYLVPRLVYGSAFLISIIYYTQKTYKLLNKHRKRLKDSFSYFSEKNELNWLYVLTTLFALTYVIYFSLGIYNVLQTNNYFNISYISNIFLSLLAFAVSYFGIKQPYLFNEALVEEKNAKITEEKYKNSNLSDLQKEKYIKHLNYFMETEKPYLNAELTVQDLSRQLNFSRHHLTEILNNDIGKNFFTFINEYRVQEVKRRLLDEKFNHLTIVAIAYESGFNSKSTFNSIFKQYTDKTPSQWKKDNIKV